MKQIRRWYYFSEELKAVLPYGYKFSKINLFNKYVNHFFEN